MDSEILNMILSAEFPKKPMEDLSHLFTRIKNYTVRNPNFKMVPLAIRSSSFLEDEQSNQFKGIYDSFFIPQSSDADEDFSRFLEAIKLVYASTFMPKAYFYRLQNHLPEDRMGIIAQFVVGGFQERGFGPDFSGVMHFDSKDLIKTSVNKGLNTTVVDGKSLFNYTNPLTQDISTASMVMIENILYQLLSPQYGSLVDIVEKSKYYENPIRKDEIAANVNFSVNLGNLASVRRVVNGIAGIFKDITSAYGHGEAEFSVLGKRNPKIFFLQWRPRPIADLTSPNLPGIEMTSNENKIFESSSVIGVNDITGHLLIDPAILPLIGTDLTLEKSADPIAFAEAIALNFDKSFIYLTCLDSGRGNIAPFAMDNIIGIINLSEMPYSSGAHLIERFERKNAPILSGLDINKDNIKSIFSGRNFFSDSKVRLVSDGKNGIVHLIGNQ